MPRRSAVVLAVCLAAAFTTLLDQASMTTAVPSLRSSLGAGPVTTQWILAGYSLTFGLALVPAGRLGDRYGRRGLFAGGIALFTLSAVLAGTATEPWVVAAARLLQGAGAGIVNPQVYGIIQDLFTGRDRARALGAYATVGGVAGVIGPVVGGVVISLAGPAHGWRFVLLLTVPFGLLTIPLALRLLPRPTTVRRTPLDLPGLALLAVVTLGLLLPFVLHPATLAGAVLGLAALLWWERRCPAPLLLPELLGSRGYTLGVLTAMFQFGASLSTTLVLVLYLQDTLGWSPLRAAVTALPSALGFACASWQSWRVVGRFGRRGVACALAAAVTADLATVVIVNNGIGGQAALMATQLAMGLSGGLIVSPNQALTLAHAPAAHAGLAGAFLQVTQRISATVATAAVTGIVLTRSSTAALVVCAALMTAALICSLLDLRGGYSRSAERRRFETTESSFRS
ncbi:MFS transporter [Actinoplanes sp. NBRC 101535]|uniref:MFS transporter n=1 Tax=Actinoplanes sp. NBRC 101535 TaxID=3032196 RepID=UPI0024A548A9|nr:MFS transporter [Actinoplanes sp. NBRC 101535]GLY03094.1 MFS transporter [Actinoplanes sp. NBRC 101535]